MSLPRKPGFPLNPFGSTMRRSPSTRPGPPDQYQDLQASLLYCPTCKQATPTRERLLLVLPSGDLYEYRCARCGTSTGSKTKNA
ncbi:MAG: cytoplasmic protein [Nitrospira sp.]